MGDYYCYVLTTPENRRTYVGITNNLSRRIRQHRSEIKGGAKYTTGHGRKWTYACLVRGFREKSHVLSFEWWVKHESRRRKGRPMERRCAAIRHLVGLERWNHLEVARCHGVLSDMAAYSFDPDAPGAWAPCSSASSNAAQQGCAPHACRTVVPTSSADSAGNDMKGTPNFLNSSA